MAEVRDLLDPDRCLEEQTALDYAAGTLVAPSVRSVEAHAAGCAVCRRLLLALADADGAPAADRHVGRYRLIDRLGSGAMGVVYRAHDAALGRDVAVKVIGPMAAGGDAAMKRLAREARAMARITDRHVVAIHDVGTMGDGELFLAMELVEGGTLSTWLAAERRERRTLFRIFAQIARGLATIHAAGIVHRDFKPDNVLLGTDGVAKVTDFGLARDDAAPLDELSDAGAPSHGRPALETLTATGLRAGTPAYMAPEQHLGLPADARADQFAFAVALHEALLGAGPFEGATAAERRAAVLAGRRRDLPRRGLPRALLGAIEIALARDPAARHASMAPLVAALERAAADRHRSFLALGGGVAIAAIAVIAVIAVWPAQPARDPCAGVGDDLERSFGAEQRRALAAALATDTRPGAAAIAARVEARLADYANGLRAASQQACAATWVDHTQSEAILDLRGACLAGRRDELDGIVGLILARGGDGLYEAPALAASMAPLSLCSQAAIANGAELNDELTHLALSKHVQRELAAVTVLHVGGRLAQAISRVEALLAELATAGAPSIEALVRYRLGELQLAAGALDDAAATLRLAVTSAEAAHSDRLRAWALTDLAWLVGIVQERTADGEQLAGFAEAALARSGNEPSLEVKLMGVRGNLLRARGANEEALAMFEHLLNLDRGRASGEDVAATLNNLAMVLFDLGRTDQALARFAEAHTTLTAALGAEHPDVAVVAANLALAEIAVGTTPSAGGAAGGHRSFDPAAPLARLRDAHRALVASLGSAHPRTVTIAGQLARVEGELGTSASPATAQSGSQ